MSLFAKKDVAKQELNANARPELKQYLEDISSRNKLENWI